MATGALRLSPISATPTRSNYDADAEHNRLRGLLAPMTERIARCQFELPDAA
jgi:hypothetical protein